MILWAWPYLAFGFLVGSIPFGVIISRVFFKTDIRTTGSGNIGAANALRTLGKKAGAAILLLDALKGVVPIFVAGRLALGVLPLIPTAPSDAAPAWWLMPLAGLAAILGHCYSPWLRFKGGKGVATFLGAACALSWPSGLAFAIVWIVVVWRTGFASLGSMLGTAVAGIVLLAAGKIYGESAFYFAFWSLAIVVWQHRENLARLRAGTENKLDLRGSRSA